MENTPTLSNWRSSQVAAATVLGLALIIGTGIAAFSFYRVKSLSDVISVTGSAQKVITSDVVKWHANFSRTTDAENLKTGNEQMVADLKAVRGFLKSNGISDDQITITPLSMFPTYDNNPGGSGRINGYSLSQNIDIEANDIDKVVAAAQKSGDLINQGVVFSNNGLEYYYSKLNDIKVGMLAEATKNAKERALAIAENTGVNLGTMRSASMGVLQITPVNSVDVSDYGTYDTSSRVKQITAVVRASFSLK